METAPTSDPGPRHRTFLGVPRSAAAETVVLLAAALIFDALFMGGTRFRAFGAHPFWLVAMVMAAHYGTPTGIFATVLGTLLAFVGNLPPRDPLQNQSAWLLATLGKPVLWFVSAVVLGELRMRQERAKETLRTQVGALEAQNGALTVANADLNLPVDRLRTAAAGQVQTTVALFQAAKTVETQQTGSVFASVEALIQSVLTPTAYSIYLRTDDHLDLVVQTTDGKAAEAQKRYEAASPLYQSVVLGSQVVHVATADGARILGRDGVLAGPLLDVETGTALGMLKVEAMPLTMLRADSLHAFRALCEWIGSAYRKALRFEEANKARVTVPGSQLFSDAFYQSVTTFLLALAERAHFEVSQMTIRVALEADPRATIPGQMREIVEKVVTHGLRTTDLAFDYIDARGEYVVLLPMTPPANCQIVSDRLRERIVRLVEVEGFLARTTITYEALYTPTPDDIKRWHRPLFRRTAPYEIQ